MKIVPAVDLIDGCCVRLTAGRFESVTNYSDDPVGIAQEFAEAGFSRLHLVDLDGARAGEPKQLAVLEAIKKAVPLEVDYSGGVRTRESALQALDAGADLLTLGSVAVRDPERFCSIADQVGFQRIVLAADVRGEQVVYSGWNESDGNSIFNFLEEWLERGVRTVMCTAVTRDGTLMGPDRELYQALRTRFSRVKLIASGGVGTKEDLFALQQLGMSEVIVGKAFYEKRISFSEAISVEQGVVC